MGEAWLLGLAKRFFPLRTAIREVDDLVEISDLGTAVNSSLSLQPPVSASSRRSLPLRIAEGALVALLVLGIGLSWLLLAQKPHLSSHAGATPTASTNVSPSWQGHSVSLTAVNGVVYVGAMDNAVYALRAADGGLLWRYTTAGPAGEPVVVAGIVYVNANVDRGLGYATGYIYALRASDGTLLWRYSNGSFVYHGYLDWPTVVSGVAYIASQDGTLSALRANDGTLLWRYTEGTGGGSPVVVNGIVYILSTNIDQSPDYLEALRASDGKLLWRHEMKGQGVVIAEVINGLIYGEVFGNQSPNHVDAWRASDGSQLWQSSDHLAILDMLDGIVYTSLDNNFEALQASTGAVLWRTKLDGSPFYAPFTVNNGVLYLVATNISDESASTAAYNGGYALQAYPAAASLQKTVPEKKATSSVYALRIGDGTVLWHYKGNNTNG